jgi:hypothetical protein
MRALRQSRIIHACSGRLTPHSEAPQRWATMIGGFDFHSHEERGREKAMHRTRTVFLAALVVACSGRPTAERLADGQAKDLIEDWAAMPRMVRLGPMTVVRTEEPQWDKGEINLTIFISSRHGPRQGLWSLKCQRTGSGRC